MKKRKPKGNTRGSLYVAIKEGRAHRTVDDYYPVLIDLDKKGRVLGVEVLDYEKVEEYPES